MASLSPDMSDDEPSRISSANHGKNAPETQSQQESSNSEDEKPQNGSHAAPLPVQKRRRVTRACDECRRKKIKCDGKQPCTHCSIYSYECTYDKPSNRRRNPAPQYIEALENRLQRAESLLKQFLPDVDLNDPTLDPAVQQEFRNREIARLQAAGLRLEQGGIADHEKSNGHLQSMIESIGQLDLDETGGWDFHGTSSGAVFLRLMKGHFRGLLGPAEQVPFLPRPENPPGLTNLDSPSSVGSSPYDGSTTGIPDLPSKEVTRDLCYYSLNCATCLIRVVHLPSFYKRVEMMYRKSPDQLTKDDMHFKGLLFAVLALGCIYRNLDDSVPNSQGYLQAMEDGLQYYNAARHLLQDITECRDITSLQALVFMILFLQGTSNLSVCYAFVGIALRSALRMGLHRHLRDRRISPIEQEVRRRVFYVIRQMDIYVSALLGFPLLLNIEDIDQPYPTETNDEFIKDSAILPTPSSGRPSFFQAFNAHTRLMEILAKVLKYVYPMKGLGDSVMKGDTPNASYTVSYAKIKEMERDLQGWYEQLPEAWRPSPEGEVEVVRIRHLLRFAYAHVQLVLYRPFLHYVSPRLSRGKNVDELSYASAAAAISVSRNIIHIGIEIRKQGVLIGPYWFMLYTEFFAILSLVFYVLENPQKPGSNEVLEDALAGREMIAKLATKSLAADRVTKALNILFEKLPEKMNLAETRHAFSKKRTITSMKQEDSEAPLSMTTAIPTRLGRPEDGLRGDRRLVSQSGRGSFDSLSTTASMYQDPSLTTTNIHDMIPIDVSSRATPDSTSTGGSVRHQFNGFSDPNHANKQPGLHKFDSIMFPSEDPFAYPNQPMMEFQKTDDGQSLGQQGHDSSQIFMTGNFDNVDGQLLNHMPSYPIQGHGHGIDLSNSLFGGLPGGSVAGPSSHVQGHHGPRSQLLPDEERQLEEMLSAQGLQGDWGVFSGTGRFPGM